MASPIPRTSLFTFTVPVRAGDRIVVDGRLNEWTSLHKLPPIALEGERSFADVYAAWSTDGMWFAVRVSRSKALRVLPNRLSEGDCLELYIDTRDFRSAHRAGRYCHKFVVAPVGGTGRSNAPLFEHLDIQRAQMTPPHITAKQVKIAAMVASDEYTIELFLPRDVLNGYDVDVTRRMGLAYVLRDTEHGAQTWPHSGDLPVWSDTSLWATIELVD